MSRRSAAALAVTASIAIVLAAVGGSAALGERPGPSAHPTIAPSFAAVATPATGAPILGGPTPTPASSSPYTFDDEFDGTSLSPIWQRDFSCCGDLAGFDPSLATVANGDLSLSVVQRDDGWYAYLIDTKGRFSQLYGTFEARIKIPSGDGLWPAFWGYSTDGRQAEIDTMEVCGGGAGASVLHNSVHWSDRGSASHLTRTVDLSQDFHVYAVDWQPDHITFSLDGRALWTFTDTSQIPSVPMPVILDLGVGGRFCGPADSTTPNGAQMLVDWVRVLP